MSRFKRRALLCGAALLFACGFASAAEAQVANPVPARPEYPSVDEQGVDLTTGEVAIADVEAAVGDPEYGGLGRVYLGAGLRDNLSGAISATVGEVFTVSAGSHTATFAWDPTTLQLISLSPGHSFREGPNGPIYTAPDGTEAEFNRAMGKDNPLEAEGGVITKLTRPDGETLTYTYTRYTSSCPSTGCYRVQAITSNRGYMLKYEYAGSERLTGSLNPVRITAVNLAQEYCEPAAPSCTFARTWTSRAYSGPAVGTTPLTATDALGRTTTYRRNALEKVDQIVRPGGATWTYTYNWVDDTPGLPSFRVTSATTPNGTWTYDWGLVTPAGGLNSQRQVTVTSPLGVSRAITLKTYRVNGPFRVAAVRDERNQTTTYDADAFGQITRITLPEQNAIAYAYDGRGNVTSVTRVPKPGSGLADDLTTFGYSTDCPNPKTCNRPQYVVERGARTDFTYDPAHGGVLSVTSPAGAGGVRPETRYSYTPLYAWRLNAAGQVVQESTPVHKLTGSSMCVTGAAPACLGTADELRMTLARGAPGAANNLQVSAMTLQAGDGSQSSVTSYAYNVFGDVRTIDGPLPGADDTVRNRYDNARQRVGRILPDPDGPGGRPANAMRFTYAPDGQLQTEELGVVASQSDTDWLNFAPRETRAFDFDAARRVSKQTRTAAGSPTMVTQYSYDPVGRLDCRTQRMNPNVYGALPGACSLGTAGAYGADRITKHTYNNVGQLRMITEGVGTADVANVSALTFSPNGVPQTLTDANGNLTTYEQDGFDRPKRIRYPDPVNVGVSSTTDFAELTYDPTTWAVTSERKRDGQVVSYGYDARGNMTSKSLPTYTTQAFDNLDRMRSAAAGGVTSTTTYDALGRKTAEGGPLGAVGHGYDAAGRMTRTTWPDGFFVTFERDPAGAMVRIRENGSAEIVAFGFDGQNRRASMTSGGAVTTYAYDGFSRPTTLGLDLAGTASDLTRGFTYNPAGELVSRSNSNAAYGLRDLPRGHTWSVNGRNQITAYDDLAIQYDGRGNLSSDGGSSFAYDVENRLVSGAGAVMGYDPYGRLERATPAGGTATRYLHDGLQVIGEYTAAGGLLRRYVQGPGADEPLVQYDGAAKRWLLADERGSIVAHADAGGASLATNIYDEYGVPGAANQGLFQYTGQRRLPGLLLYDFKSRTYSPVFKRFLQTDPIGYEPSANLYAYVDDDPINLADPRGTQAGLTIGEVEVRGIRLGLDSVLGAWNQARSLEALQGLAANLRLFAGIGSSTIGGIGLALIPTEVGDGTICKGNPACVADLISRAEGATDPNADDSEADAQSESETQERAAPNRLRQDVVKGRAPKEVDRVDPPHDEQHGKPHVHLKDGRSFNNDGTWREGGSGAVPKVVRQWVEKYGWKAPR